MAASIPLVLIISLIFPLLGTAQSLYGSHYYVFVKDIDRNYTDAEAAARARVFRGVSGHLVTITSSAENEFINGWKTSLLLPFIHRQGLTGPFPAWIGARSNNTGVYVWSDGPEIGQLLSSTYINLSSLFVCFHPCGLYKAGVSLFWDAQNASVPLEDSGYVVEFECPVAQEFGDSSCQSSTFFFLDWLILEALTLAPSGRVEATLSVLTWLSLACADVTATSDTPSMALNYALVCVAFELLPSNLDMDACLLQPCHANATCTDLLPPSTARNCSCNTGFVGNGINNCTGRSAA
jgi:hypothetical protein